MLMLILQKETNVSETTSTSSSDSEENNSPNRQKLVVGTQMYKKLQRPTVHDILKENEQGRLILRNYSQSKVLSKYSRHVLVELLTSHLINTVKGYVKFLFSFIIIMKYNTRTIQCPKLRYKTANKSYTS